MPYDSEHTRASSKLPLTLFEPVIPGVAGEEVLNAIQLRSAVISLLRVGTF